MMPSTTLSLPTRDQLFVQQGRDTLEFARWLSVLAGQPISILERFAQDSATMKGQAAQTLLRDRFHNPDR